MATPGGAKVADSEMDRLFAKPQITHERAAGRLHHHSLRARAWHRCRASHRHAAEALGGGGALARLPGRARCQGRVAEDHLRGDGAATNAIAQSLLDRGLGPDRPLLILADNGIDHGLMALGAMHVGVPVVPVSTPYARMSQDYGKLRYIFDLIKPGMIYVDEADRYAKALETIGATSIEVVASRGSLGEKRVTPFSTLTDVRPTPAVDAAFAKVGPDTVAKILFTSGSTGMPKGVINTQRMMCANQESAAAAWRFLEARPPVIVDWLPWNHTFGANHNFNMMLRNGGTLYIDEGKPVPALIGKTIANLRDVSPTVYFNVPRGYAVLLDHLEKDEALQQKFFERLDLLFYAAAVLPQTLWDRLERLGVKVRGRDGAVRSPRGGSPRRRRP